MRTIKNVIAEYLHNNYERYSKRYKWKTQEKTRVKFSDLPEENKKVMLRIADDIYNLLELSYRNGKEDATKYFNQESLVREMCRMK